MSAHRIVAVSLSGAAAAIIAGCGHSTAAPPRFGSAPVVRPAVRSAARPRVSARPPAPVALITAPTENEVLVVGLPGGRIIRRVRVPGGPVYAAGLGTGGPVVVVSSQTGTVTLLGGPRLAREAVLRGLRSPHIPAMAPGGGWVYVTDDASGRVAAIGLSDRRFDSSTDVGAGAHHLAFSPDAARVWVALGQAARTIVVLSTVVSSPPPPSSPTINPGHPHVVGR